MTLYHLSTIRFTHFSFKHSRQHSLLIAIFICSIAVFLSACDLNTPSNKTTPTKLAPAEKQSIEVVDFSGKRIILPSPARRIVALSPHSVENVFSAGAGDLLIARSAYSDFPEEAKELPIISQYNQLNLEQLIELHPDLVIAWQSGIQDASIQKIRSLGIPIYLSEAEKLSDIAKELTDIGLLTKREIMANKAAKEFTQKLSTLKDLYSTLDKKTVFYQISASPLYTVGGNQIISQVIRLCGGKNIFADQTIKAPLINKEAVIERNPDILITSNGDNLDYAVSTLRSQWGEWTQMSAVQKNHFFALKPDTISRASTRIIEGATDMCHKMNLSRN